MTKCYIFFFLCVCLLTWMALDGADADVYARVAVVDSVDEATDIVVFVDSVGFLWEIEGIEDWFIGDAAALLMDNQGTNSIFDDVVIGAYYSSFDIH